MRHAKYIVDYDNKNKRKKETVVLEYRDFFNNRDIAFLVFDANIVDTAFHCIDRDIQVVFEFLLEYDLAYCVDQLDLVVSILTHVDRDHFRRRIWINQCI